MTWFAVGSALGLGILTSISPCPLASNIAAISFIGRKTSSARMVLLNGLLYTLGRTVAYLALGVIIMAGLMASSDVSGFFTRHLNQFLGPVLILVGMLLLGLLNVSASLNLAGTGLQQRAGRGGAAWALPLGMLFALSFCPVSAGLFFGGLIPLSTSSGSRFLVPTLYGIGTALPVIVFAFLMAFASQAIGRAFNILAHIDRWARGITGTIFIVVGVYYSLAFVYLVPIPLHEILAVGRLLLLPGALAAVIGFVIWVIVRIRRQDRRIAVLQERAQGPCAPGREPPPPPSGTDRPE